MKIKKNAMLSMFIMMIAVLFVAGCGGDDDTEITNSQPIIDSVIVPESVQAGERVQLEVIAHDADGDELSYSWEVSAGTVDAVGVWSVPSDATGATVLVHVGDGVNSAVTSSPISVDIVAPPGSLVPQGMVSIPAGEFQMGSNDPRTLNDEQPLHTVYVDAFFMDQHEVTNLEYQEFVLANPEWQREEIDSEFHNEDYLKLWRGIRGNDYPKGKADHPVVYVSWYAAMAYAEWVGKRLPTEAEWEYAARGGLVGKKYPWGDEARTIPRWPRGDYVEHDKANHDRSVGDTTAVGEYPPNGYGLYDMAGNVWEWCLDEYNEDFYSMSPRENPLSGADSVDWFINNFTSVTTHRVLRGGSWHTRNVLGKLSPLRVTFRRPTKPLLTTDYFGFRCVRSE